MIKLRLGTRASALARWQAEWVARAITSHGAEPELVTITTRGDANDRDPIGDLGETGAFTKELQRALIENRIDIAVHSLKDLPTDPVPGLILAAVPERHSPRDVLISRNRQRLAELPPGAVIGTGSLRRRAQLLYARPELLMKDIRGNVDTRLAKLAAGEYDALVLAEAGIARLALEQHITEVLDPAVMLPAVGQGALGIEVRASDRATIEIVAAINHRPSHEAVLSERAMLATLRGGCLAPVGGWCRLVEDRLQLTGAVIRHDGSTRLLAEAAAPLDEAESLGVQVARQLLEQGAADLIAAARQAI